MCKIQKKNPTIKTDIFVGFKNNDDNIEEDIKKKMI